LQKFLAAILEAILTSNADFLAILKMPFYQSSSSFLEAPFAILKKTRSKLSPSTAAIIISL
jgi:hypothetical protein